MEMFYSLMRLIVFLLVDESYSIKPAKGLKGARKDSTKANHNPGGSKAVNKFNAGTGATYTELIRKANTNFYI